VNDSSDLTGVVSPELDASSSQGSDLLAGGPLMPGLRLGKWELLYPIGSGGMASVWIVRKTGGEHHELAAVKILLPHYSQHLRCQRMFLDEARIASCIDDVHVARILDSGWQGGVLYLVMEWVDGDSLLRLQRAVQNMGMQVAPGIALRVVADACCGLHAAHELRDLEGAPLGVVHRDVSPHNILLNVEGTAKVIDFGIAKARRSVAGETTEGILRGKLLYISPEQALGRPVDRRADVWSLGAVLYDLLAGAPPFQGDTDEATFAFLISRLPPPPLAAQIPAPVARVVRKALAPLEQRYATAAALKDAIEEAMTQSGLTTRREDVAAYVGRHLGALVAARRSLLQEAIATSDKSAQAEASRSVKLGASRRGWTRGGAAAVAGLLATGLLATTLGRRLVSAPATPDDGAALAVSAAPPVALANHDSPPQLPQLAGQGTAPDIAAPATMAPTIRGLHEPAQRGSRARSQHASALDCDPPFEFDSGGVRRYKRYCLR
jgi:serine/threonine protein kinase